MKLKSYIQLHIQKHSDSMKNGCLPDVTNPLKIAEIDYLKKMLARGIVQPGGCTHFLFQILVRCIVGICLPKPLRTDR